MPGVSRRARHLAELAMRYGVGTAIDDPRELNRLANEMLTGRTRARMASWTEQDLAATNLGDRMARRLARWGRAVPDLRSSVIGTITDWVSDRMGHKEATARLAAAGTSVQVGDAPAGWLFQAAKLAGSAGLFVGSYSLLQSGYDQVLANARPDAGYAARVRGVLVELQRRQVGSAVDRWSQLLAIRLPRGLSGTAGSALDTVLSAVTDRPLPGGRNGIVPDSGWRASIDGRSVAIVGPAPSRHLAAAYDLRAGIANLALLGDKESGLGHDELVYLNNETWATHPRAEILASVGDYTWLVLKSRTSDPPPRSRVLTWGAGLLFLAGTPNLMPLICFDLLTGGAGQLFLTGMDFYASPPPYARVRSAENPPFRDSARIASHNPIENRAFIANLLGSPRVSADPVVERVARLDDLDYLRLLDEHYGRPRR